MTVKITREFIFGNRSDKNGWNFAQISALGEAWPPRKGWIDRAIGREISEEVAAYFIAYGKKRPTKQERRAIKKKIRTSVRRKPTPDKPLPPPQEDAFLLTYEWRSTRMQVLKRDGARCACCGATPKDGVRMHVDHIKPRKLFPQLALDPANLQVLCEVCNHGKGNWDQTDWRKRDAVNDSLHDKQAHHISSIVRGY